MLYINTDFRLLYMVTHLTVLTHSCWIAGFNGNTSVSTPSALKQRELSFLLALIRIICGISFVF